MNPKDVLTNGLYAGKKLLYPKKSVELLLENLLYFKRSQLALFQRFEI